MIVLLALLPSTAALVTGAAALAQRHNVPAVQRHNVPAVQRHNVPAVQFLSANSYVALAGVQAGALGATADAVSQRLQGLHIEGEHVAAMAVLAFALSGAANSVWMRYLEERIPGPGPRAVWMKTMFDFCCCATLFNAAFLCGVPFLTDVFAGSPAQFFDGWASDDFVSLMQMEACTFVPYNLCAFRLVPTDLRPLGSASISAITTMVLSRVTLGFGI